MVFELLLDTMYLYIGKQRPRISSKGERCFLRINEYMYINYSRLIKNLQGTLIDVLEILGMAELNATKSS